MTGKAQSGYRAYTRYPTRSVDDQEWRLDAACRGANPDQFSPHRGDGRGAETAYRNAVIHVRKQFCNHCPVVDDCLNDALDRDNRFGIWGGLGENDRPHGGRA